MTLALNGLWQTLLLFVAVCGGGIALIYRTARRLEDRSLLNLRWVFIVKIVVVLALAAMWNHRLLIDTAELKPDQQRYFYQAIAIGKAGLTPSSVVRIVQNINYPGVLYIYGALFLVFGANIFSAALFNTFLTLLTTLLLIRVAYRVKERRDRFDWILGLTMLVPDILYSDATTSRDTLAMSLLSISVLLVANFLLQTDANAWLTLSLVAICFLLLAAVRTTALIPAVASILVLFAKFRSRVKLRSLALASAAALLFLIVAPKLSESLGGYRMTFMQIMNVTVINPAPKFIDGFTWSPRSVGRLLVPKSAAQAVLFAIPRMIAYLVVPLPAFRIPARLDWTSTQDLLACASSVLYLALLPLAIIAIKQRDAAIALVAPFWLTLLTVAGGTAVLHERYRVMMVPFLCGCIWLGRIAPRRQWIVSYAAWASVLVAGAAAYVVYKHFPA